MLKQDISWLFPEIPIELEDDEIHIWRINVAQPDLKVSQLYKTISEQEEKKADDQSETEKESCCSKA